MPNLKAVQLLGAGVDSVINDPELPDTVPLLRIADPLMGQRMATWVRNVTLASRVQGHCCPRGLYPGYNSWCSARHRRQADADVWRCHTACQGLSEAPRTLESDSSSRAGHAWAQVVWAVINSQRQMEAYAAAQRQRFWDKNREEYSNKDNCDIHIGILGYGARPP